MAENGNGNGERTGRVEQVIGVVVDAVFPEELPEIYSRAEDRDSRGRRPRRDRPDPRGPAAPRRRPRPRGRDGRDRRPAPRRHGHRHRLLDHGPGRQGHARADLQPARRADRRGRAGRGRGSLADPPPGPDRGGPDPDAGDPRDRHQGRRPARSLRQGRQGRPVRRRRRRQDRSDPGADQQHRRPSTAACPPSAASASGPARATTSTSRCRSPASSTRR